MVHLQDRAVHVMAMLLNAAANLAHMVVGQADGLLPESQLLVALAGEKADVEVLLGKIHGGKCSAKSGRVPKQLSRILPGDPVRAFAISGTVLVRMTAARSSGR